MTCFLHKPITLVTCRHHFHKRSQLLPLQWQHTEWRQTVRVTILYFLITQSKKYLYKQTLNYARGKNTSGLSFIPKVKMWL